MGAINFLVLAIVLTVMINSTVATPEKVYYNVKEGPALFEQFMKDYDRHYKDEADRKVHYDAFVKNLAMINKLNAENASAVFGITKFTDYTREEQKKMFGYLIPH